MKLSYPGRWGLPGDLNVKSGECTGALVDCAEELVDWSGILEDCAVNFGGEYSVRRKVIVDSEECLRLSSVLKGQGI